MPSVQSLLLRSTFKLNGYGRGISKGLTLSTEQTPELPFMKLLPENRRQRSCASPQILEQSINFLFHETYFPASRLKELFAALLAFVIDQNFDL